MRILGLAAVAAGVTLCLSTAPARAETGAQLAKALEGSRPVFREGVTIDGVVDLRDLRAVSVPFVCRRCRIPAGIVARHVRFERTVDLGSSTLGRVDVEGARFGEALLFGKANMEGPANFSFATFEDLTDFAEAKFGGETSFSSARFDALARFSNGQFGGVTRFLAARFGREALFSRALFTGSASFEGAVFEHVTDFRSAQFFGPARFRNCDFAGTSEFTRARMTRTADFSDSRFAEDAIFVGTVFDPKPRPSVTFEGTSVGGQLDLTAASLHGHSQFLNLSAGTLVFRDTVFAKTTRLDMNQVTATQLELSLPDVSQISQVEDQVRALERIEATAKEAGQIKLANDARYRLQELVARDDWPPRRVADFLLYRWVAGYLVRPHIPFLWLAGLVLLFSLIRTAMSESRPERLSNWRVAKTGGRFVKALAYTVSPSSDEKVPAHRRLELVLYALLLACFLIGLANSNPTLREMVDAVI